MTHAKQSLIDQALAELRATPDPYVRLREADRLDGALAVARTVVAQIKRSTINQLRTPTSGYGRIAERLGLTKARVQQIANASSKLGPVAYAVRDEQGTWYGEPDLLPSSRYRDAAMPRPFQPTDQFNPLAGQVLTVRCGDIASDDQVTVYAIRVIDSEAGGRELAVRMSQRVLDAVFGPAMMGSPERAIWERAREERRRQLGEA
jgi:hypothetical protein